MRRRCRASNCLGLAVGRGAAIVSTHVVTDVVTHVAVAHDAPRHFNHLGVGGWVAQMPTHPPDTRGSVGGSVGGWVCGWVGSRCAAPSGPAHFEKSPAHSSRLVRWLGMSKMLQC